MKKFHSNGLLSIISWNKSIIFSGLLFLLFSLPVNAQLNPADKIKFTEQFEAFDDGWQMKWGDSPLDTDGVPVWTKSDDEWASTDKLYNPEGREGQQYLWFKTKLKNNNWNDPCVFIPWVYYSFEVYINQTIVYQHGKNQNGSFAELNGFPPFHLIPFNKNDEGKTLYIRVYSAGKKRIGLTQGNLIGSMHSIHINQLRVDAPRAVMSVILLALSLFMISMFIRSPSEGGLYITFGLFLMAMGIWNYSNSHWNRFFYDLGSADMYVELFALFLSPPSLMYYFDRLFNGGYKNIIRWVARIFLLFFIAGVLSSLAGPIFLYENFLPLFQTLVMPLMIIPFGFVLYRAVVRKDTEARILVAGLFAFILTSIFDLTTSFLGWASFMPRLTYFGMLIMVASQAIIIGRRFKLMTVNLKLYSEELEDAKSKLEDYATNLEIKVDERTKQLQNANEELEAAYEEVEAMNDNLLNTNNQLEDAKRIADRDMFMAINVQTSFFPPKAPASSTWEIAFAFKPMSGVSGDLYDFYTDTEGSLTGTSMFDVSGHGIASGLITMLAKSIVFRRFTSMKDEKLNVVIKKIHEDLLNEIGSIDNYLTGVILRFNEDSVEYVNAGHTDLLVKSASSGKVSPLIPKDKDFKGYFIGVDSVPVECSSVSFKLKSNDTILLYSDCLIESQNLAKEQYGVELLSESISKINPELSAEKQLNLILNDFHNFTQTEKLHDDLTVIIIRKK